ncbi:LytTR family DNA-binding domain-containing protein [Rhodocytophaga aerolata]|uniref:LytTR family DNA-binding domain-containing protein n=1 Tax=Rhodocytophaga aerolata TaxID=455078 RepID=A0ABT8R5P9_9BACT|nr:LytTR family DNA-binding domain-containing protein [Rhodocytophaga aerolata]MDO1447259.1 LytTR family DNA-binding domain-containing protein [Rhodocytophaga aerolata]
MPENTVSHPLPIYRDKWIQLIAIPVITLFSYYLTYNNIQLNWLLGYELLSDALKVYLVWQTIRRIVIELDRRNLWQKGIFFRLLLQIPLTCLAGILVLTALVYVEYAFIRPYQLEHFFDFDIVIAIVFILLGNVVYVGLYYYDLYLRSLAEKQELAQKLAKENRQASHIVVRMGKKEILVSYPEIQCFYSEEKETFLLTADNKTYLVDSSLDKLEEQLPETYFFRANRKFIIAPIVVKEVQSGEYGKLLVTLKETPKLPVSIPISREKAAAFRQWLKR